MRQTNLNNVQTIGRPDHPMRRGPGMTLQMDEAGRRWLQGRKAVVKDSTYIKYETVWRCHIQPVLGGLRVETVDMEAAEAFTRSLTEAGLAAKTVRDILAVLRSVLAFAASQGYVVQPLHYMRYPKEPRKQMRVLTREEQDRLAAYLHQDMDCCQFGILLAMLTGIRLGELCALRWENVSERERIISINATMQRLRVLDGTGGKQKTHVVIGPPKSDAAVRTIPMSDHAAALCREMGPCGPDCFILTGTERYMEPRAVQFRMEKITKICGLEGVHFHTLRHTFATRSVEVGFELKSLSEVLGHANTTITLNRYVHASMEMKRTNMNKLALAGL